MHCEYQQNCGFYLFLAARGLLVDGGCGKENIIECPRYIEASGATISSYLKGILRLEPEESVYRHDGLLTNQETLVANRNYRDEHGE